ncbi:MAG: diaminopimelate epimerase [Phycisphaerales bacterium]|nr:diaminopimelate epimerase [Phycisphaerales bacterium]
MRFAKMHGLGNDYVYIDAMGERLWDLLSPVELPVLARAISDRNFGVGSDGLIVVDEPSAGIDAHVRMRMFNADGSEAQMCGNGLRCVCKFAVDRAISAANPLLVETGRGVLEVAWTRGVDGKVERATADMGEPRLVQEQIPAIVPKLLGDVRVVQAHLPLKCDTSSFDPRVTLVNMGNPHAVFFCAEPDAVNLEQVGPIIERHPWFPERINAHFVQVCSRDRLRMRTWERGSGVTLACGTGACAVAVAGVLTGQSERLVTVQTPGGELSVHWREEDSHVMQTGTAIEVFLGTLDLGSIHSCQRTKSCP